MSSGFGLSAEVSHQVSRQVSQQVSQQVSYQDSLRGDSRGPGVALDPAPSGGLRPLDDTSRPSLAPAPSGHLGSRPDSRRPSGGAPSGNFGLAAETGQTSRTPSIGGGGFGFGAEIGGGDAQRASGLPPRAAYPSDNLGDRPGYGLADERRRPSDAFGLAAEQPTAYGLSGAINQAEEAGRLALRQDASRTHTSDLDRQVDHITRRPINMTEEQAAIRIQSAFRGFQARKSLYPDLPQSYREQRGRRVSIVARDPQSELRLPAMPVIDINKLPRYGVLAPPIGREPKQAGRYVQYDRATSTMVKNRGVLREAVEHKTGYLEEAPIRMWSAFALRQQQRYVPVPPDAHRRVLPETQGYRLRILRINDLPLHTTFDGRTFEFQLGVSLFDEAYGTFYGNTVYNMSDSYDRNRAAQRNAVDLDFSFDVYFHSSISDPRCMAVVEVIMLERMIDGVVKGQYSLGWALLPLFKISAPQPGIQGPGGVMVDDVPGKPLSVPLVAGTPRYLLFRNVYNEDLRPPRVIANCAIMFTAEQYPAADAFIPLLPEDFLVTYSDVVPGLRRFDTAGQLSITTKTVISTLASPMLSPTYSVVLRRLQMAIPSKVHDLLMTLDTKQALPVMHQRHMPADYLGPLPTQDEYSGGLRYTIRVGVHNGRTFVGPAYELVNLTHLDVPGWKVLQVPAPDAVFDYLMGDVFTTIIVELLAEPPQVLEPGMLPARFLIGWTPFVPFSFISDDGTQSEVAVGVHRYPLTGKKGLILRDQAPLNWRSMLGDSMNNTTPDPLVEFQLFESGRTPIPPPLRRKFAAIEYQREEEAAMGELPLEQVLAAVPVPQELQEGIIADQAAEPPLLFNSDLMGDRAPFMDPEEMKQPVLPPILREREEAMMGRPYHDTSARDQEMRELTEAMQRQLELLTRAVGELRDERKSLRNSVLALADRDGIPAQGPVQQANMATSIEDMYGARRQPRGMQPTPDEIRRFMDLPPTTDFGDPNFFHGGLNPAPREPGTVPSRLLMQQLYDAGMVDGLPEDVQQILRRKGPPRGPSTMPIDLAIESRDPRMASDVVFQFLAFRHHDTLNAPSNLQSIYFTFQFYHFPPTTTEMAYLVQPPPLQATQAQGNVQRNDDTVAMEQLESTLSSTRILVTNNPMRKGAGITLKYVVDGTTEPLATGQTPQQAAFEQAMLFAQYLGMKKLSVDVWDGESLLQVGTANIDLHGLLRQGRDFAELLVEVPILDQSNVLSEHDQNKFNTNAFQPGGANDTRAPSILSKGSIVLRLINIGREPRNMMPGAKLPDLSRNGPKRVRVRVRPAWEVRGPIQRELANGNGLYQSMMVDGDPYLSEDDRRPYKRQHGDAGPGPSNFDPYPHREDVLRASTQGAMFGYPSGTSNLVPNQDQALGSRGLSTTEDNERKMMILEKAHKKSARIRQYNQIREADHLPDPTMVRSVGMAPPAPTNREDQFRRVQKQLLTDVSSVRGRLKDSFIRDQLRKNMVIRRVIKPSYGEVVVYEHEFINPYAQEMTFDVRVSHPQEVCVITRMDEYRALRAANARFFGNPSQPVGHLEQETMAGSRLFMQAHERITLPFKLQSFEPPDGYTQPPVTRVPEAPYGSRSNPLGASTNQRASMDISSSVVGISPLLDENKGHVVNIELVSVHHDHPIVVLELQIVPKALIIDRTFRFFQAEKSLMRQTIKVKNLAGADTTFPPGALKNLAVACSHQQVISGTGSSGLAGTERDEVYVKYTCGSAPEVAHFYVLLYLDRLLARPVEVWQVFAHSLRKVDMRAMIGQTSQASVVVRGSTSSRRVACYTSHPDELQVAPDGFVLVAGALTEMLVSFRPVTQGIKDIKVHLVDVETRELVYALIVVAEAQGPLVTRTFEVELPAGAVANKKITYTNPYQSFRTFTLRSNQPWLVHFTPQRLQLPAGATRPLGLTFDARAATTGIVDTLVFVNDEEEKTEECFKVRVRIYR